MEYPLPSSRIEAFPAGLRVLVVDDDPCWLKILEKMLRKCSYEVTTCCLARVALDMLRERKDRFDIVISDVNMPDMDGFKLLEHVGLEMDLPVIMMSVDGETSRVMKGVQHGACDYLLKPVRMKELRNIWQHVFRKRIHEVKEIESHDSSEGIHFMRNGSEDFDDSQVLSGVDLNSARKRKDVDNKDHIDEDLIDPAAVKKARVVWSVDLHQKFVNAVNLIGFDKVGPKKILDLMNVPGLTRENVASHLQKYRLYLSRIQKQNEGRNFGNIVQPDFSSEDPPGDFGIQNSIRTQQNKSSSSYVCSPQNIHVQGITPDIPVGDLSSAVSLHVTGNKKAVTIDVTDSQKANNVHQLGVVLSFKNMMPTIDYKSIEPSISKHQPWNGAIPVMQVMHYPKHNHEPYGSLEDYSRLPQSGQEHQIGIDHLYTTPPSVISITSNSEREKTGMCQTKLAYTDYRNSHVRNISPVARTVDSVSVQVEHGLVNSEDFGATCDIKGASSIKNYYFDQHFSHSLLSPSREVCLKKGADVPPLPEDVHLYSLQGYGCFENVGLNSMEIFKYDDSASVTEVHSNLYDGLEYSCEYLYDSVDYPAMDECLFT